MTSASSHLGPTFKKHNSNKPRAKQLASRQDICPHLLLRAGSQVLPALPTPGLQFIPAAALKNLNIVALPNLDSVLSKPRPSKLWGC